MASSCPLILCSSPLVALILQQHRPTASISIETMKTLGQAEAGLPHSIPPCFLQPPAAAEGLLPARQGLEFTFLNHNRCQEAALGPCLTQKELLLQTPLLLQAPQALTTAKAAARAAAAPRESLMKTKTPRVWTGKGGQNDFFLLRALEAHLQGTGWKGQRGKTTTGRDLSSPTILNHYSRPQLSALLGT